MNGRPDGEAECDLEIMPTRSLDDLMAEPFPANGTLLGRPAATLPFGAGTRTGERATSHQLRPLPTTLWIRLEVARGPDDRVTGYRTALAWTYDTSQRAAYEQALSRLIGVPPEARGCVTGHRGAARVEVCERSMQIRRDGG